MAEPGLSLSMPSDGNQALRVMLEWLSTTPHPPQSARSPAAKAFGSPNAKDSLSSRLAAAGLPDWSDAVSTDVEQTDHSGAIHSRARWLAATAAVELAAAGEHPRLFDLVDDLRYLSGDTSAALACALSTRLADEPSRLPLQTALQARLRAVYESWLFERVRRYAEASPDLPLTTRDLWPGPNDLPMLDSWAHKVAAALWPHQYLKAVADFPATFQYAAAQALQPLNIHGVCELVAASPDVFSTEGVPLGSTVLFGLLETLEVKLAEDAAVNIAAASADLERIVEALIARPDGNWIGRAWLQHVIWRGQLRRAGRSHAAMEARELLSSGIIIELSKRIDLLEDRTFAWIRNEEPLWQVNRVLLEASVIEAHGNPTGAAAILGMAVSEGLVSATGRPAGLSTSSPEAKIVGRILHSIPDPRAWFKELWRATYEVREHSSFIRNLDNPAYPALAWGLHGLNASIPKGIDAAAFWLTLADAVTETLLTDPNVDLPNGTFLPIRLVVVQLGSRLAETGMLPSDDLARFLTDQLDSTLQHAQLWRTVRVAMSDSRALTVGRQVGAGVLACALKTALRKGAIHRRDAHLDEAACADLQAFADRLSVDSIIMADRSKQAEE